MVQKVRLLEIVRKNVGLKGILGWDLIAKQYNEPLTKEDRLDGIALNAIFDDLTNKHREKYNRNLKRFKLCDARVTSWPALTS